MINKTLRRLAVGASAITVLGVVVPLAAATSASAAEATGITATPSTQTVGPAGTASYQATLTPAGSTAANTLQSYVIGGPAGFAANQTACTPAGGGAGPFTCTQSAAAQPSAGTYTVRIYDDVNGNTAFDPAEPQTTVQMVITGPVVKTTITPTTGTQPTDQCQAYTVSSTDTAGNPAAGQVVQVTASQTNPTASGDPGNRFCDPTVKTFPATAAAGQVQTTMVSGTNTTYTETNNYTLSSGGAGNPAAGSVIIGVFSATPGTVNIMAGTNSATTNGQAATLTVVAGNTAAAPSQTNDNNAATVAVSPKTASAIAGGAAVPETVTVKNAAGYPLGGVTLTANVTGGTGSSVACTTTDQTGTATCNVTPGTAAASETLTVWVNQSTHGTNTSGLDAGEPSDTATITVSAPLTAPVFTDSCGGNTATLTVGTCAVAASAASQNVTFTLTSTAGSPAAAGVPAANQVVTVTTATAGYTLSSTQGTTNSAGTSLTATTDANGQLAVTVNHTPGVVQNAGSITATFVNGGGGPLTDSPNVNFVTPSASTLTLTPAAQTLPVGGTVTETVTVTDQLKNPVAGTAVNYSTTGANSATPGANGACTTNASGQCTITYTDKGGPLAPTTPPAATNTRSDSITATVVGVPTATATATVTFVAGTAKAANVNLATSATAATVTPDPAAGKTAPVTTLTATVKDANGNLLQNDSVTFTSSGVGEFTDATGHPTGSGSFTAQTDVNGQAKAFVRSPNPGAQTVTATADGVASSQVTVTYTNSQFTPVTPERVVDTRTNQGGLAATPGPLAPNTAYYFNLSSTDVPQGEAAYVFNVTAVHPAGAGNLRIGPDCGSGTPQTSLINYQANTDVANDVVVPNPFGCDSFVIYSAGSSANVAIDLQGYYGTVAGFAGSNPPVRAVDTRSGQGGHSGVVAANTSASFTIAGVGGVPAVGSATPAKAVAINVTAIGPGGVGNLRVYPDGATVPTTSNINYIPGTDKAAFVVVQLPADGKIDVYSAGSAANVAIDVFGYYPSTSTVVTQTPVRVFDSRTGVELHAGVPVNVPVTAPGASNGVPAGSQAVLVSLTAVHAADSTGVGNLRAYPAGQSVPTVSNINYVGKTADVANFAIVPIGSNGQITLYSAGSNINATVDILGYVPATG